MSAPIKKWRLNGVEIALWSGKGSSTYYTVGKSYKNKETGKYENTNSLYAGDLATLAQLVSLAVSDVVLNKEPAKEGAFNDSDVPF